MEKIVFDLELSDKAKEAKAKLMKELSCSSVIEKWMKENQVDLSFIERHSYKFKDYVEVKEKCNHCLGLYGCMQPKKGHILELVYDKVLSKKLCACKYMKEYNQVLKHKENFLWCDMSDTMLTHSFETIDFSKEKVSYLKLVDEMISNIKKEEKRSFYLCGEPGVGKTYLACCYINAYAKKGKKCSFVNVGNFMSILKGKLYDRDAYLKQLDSLYKADVLVLDDIGGESVSNFTRDEILLPVLNERMENNKITLFTSNYSMDNLEKYYALNTKLVNDSVGAKRILERMKTLSLEKVLNFGNRRVK